MYNYRIKKSHITALALALAFIFTLTSPIAVVADNAIDIAVSQEESTSSDGFIYSLNDFTDIMPTTTAQQHVLRIRDEETLSSVAFENSNGSKTVYFFSHPIKFYEGESIVDKDNTIVLNGGSSRYKYTNKANDIKVFFPEDLVGAPNQLGDGVKLKYREALNNSKKLSNRRKMWYNRCNTEKEGSSNGKRSVHIYGYGIRSEKESNPKG